MRRDILLLTEMIEAAEQAQELTDGVTPSDLETDRQRRDALLWNFTVLGEAASQLSDAVTTRFPDVTWKQPV
nr:HepT-like ribonuclease domain-containing protein [Frankia sp. Cppng1_Ct_nod]